MHLWRIQTVVLLVLCLSAFTSEASEPTHGEGFEHFVTRDGDRVMEGDVAPKRALRKGKTLSQSAQRVAVTNPGFEDTENSAAGWVISSPHWGLDTQSRAEGRRSLRVTKEDRFSTVTLKTAAGRAIPVPSCSPALCNGRPDAPRPREAATRSAI
jgi:hypothetical protein